MKGIGASPGVAVGHIVILEKKKIIFPIGITKDIEGERKRFHDGLREAIRELEEIQEKARREVGEKDADIFGAHIMILEDPELIRPIEEAIAEGEFAVSAIRDVTDGYLKMFEAIEDEYLAERACDIRDVRDRLYANVEGINQTDITSLPKDTILVAHELVPSDTALMDKANIVGLITEIGGATAHAAIMARNLGIPAVMGIDNAMALLKEGTTLAIDGRKGEVILFESEEESTRYREAVERQKKLRAALEIYKDTKAITKDAHRVFAFANIGNSSEAEFAHASGAEGVGLFRTEFVYMGRKRLPTEEEQYREYKSVLETFGDKPVIFRTVDIGGDKDVPYFDLPCEDNPSLGWRAIRLCFDRTEMFITQLRAILRASIHGNARVMYPMISSIDDVKQANEIMQDAKRRLREDGIPFKEDLPIGIMVEVPSAALLADKLCSYVDFFSIGTNDLTQYTLAADRGNERVRQYLNSYHPSVLQLIHRVISEGKRHGKEVGMCGEFAADPLAILLLLGMGLEEFSMSPSSITKFKKVVQTTTLEKTQRLAAEVLRLDTAQEVEQMLLAAVQESGLEELLEI